MYSHRFLRCPCTLLVTSFLSFSCRHHVCFWMLPVPVLLLPLALVDDLGDVEGAWPPLETTPSEWECHRSLAFHLLASIEHELCLLSTTPLNRIYARNLRSHTLDSFDCLTSSSHGSLRNLTQSKISVAIGSSQAALEKGNLKLIEWMQLTFLCTDSSSFTTSSLLVDIRWIDNHPLLVFNALYHSLRVCLTWSPVNAAMSGQIRHWDKTDYRIGNCQSSPLVMYLISSMKSLRSESIDGKKVCLISNASAPACSANFEFV